MASSIEPTRHQTVLKQIATYIETARGTKFPEQAREAAFRCVLDAIGTLAAGIDSRLATAVRTTACRIMGNGNIPISFSGQCSTVIGAIWADCAAGTALDLDDGHRLARGHPGLAVVMTSLHIAVYETNASFEEFITAIIVGIQVGVTVAIARKGPVHTGNWICYAVVAAAAVLRGTSGNTLVNALAIAGDSAPNHLVACAPGQIRSDVKEGIPWSVMTSLTALELAEAGHTGSSNILDCTLYYHFPKELTLGSPLHICSIYVKFYACCRYVHAPIDALLETIAEHSIDVSGIEAIEVQTHASAAKQISNQAAPTDLVEVLYSIPYCLALAAIVGQSSLLPVTDDVMSHGDTVLALASKVKISIDPELEKRFPEETLARVKVTCGRQVYVSRVTAPRGEATNPPSWEDLEGKLIAATRFVATVPEQRELLEAIRRIKTGDLTALMSVLKGMTLGCSREGGPPV